MVSTGKDLIMMKVTDLLIECANDRLNGKNYNHYY